MKMTGLDVYKDTIFCERKCLKMQIFEGYS